MRVQVLHACVLAALAAAIMAPAAAAMPQIKIAVLGDQSGNMWTWYTSYYTDTTDYLLDWINDGLGGVEIDGTTYQLNVTWYPDEWDEDVLTESIDAIDSEDIQYVIATWNSQQHVMEKTKDKDMLVCFPTAGQEAAWNLGYNHTYAMSQPDEPAFHEILSKLYDEGARSLVICQENAEPAVDHYVTGAKAKAAELNMTLYLEDECTYQWGGANYNNLLQSIKEADPDVLIVANTNPAGTGAWLQAMTQQGWFPNARIFGVGSQWYQLQVQLLGDDALMAEGALGVDSRTISLPWVDNIWYKNSTEYWYRHFAENYYQDVQFDGFVLNYFNCGYSMLLAMQRAGSITNATAVREELFAMNGTDISPGGPLQWRDNGLPVNMNWTTTQVVNGTGLIVTPDQLAVSDAMYPAGIVCRAGYSGVGDQCLPCPAGYFASRIGSEECEPCSPGYFTNNAASTSCSACPIGFSQPAEGSADCTACSKAEYQDEVAAINCKGCGVNAFSAEGTRSADGCLCLSGFYGQGLDGCKACPVGGVCPGGNGNPAIAPGYFRSPSDPAVFLRCGSVAACPGGEGANRCGPGHTGHLCASCEVGYYKLRDSCVACDLTPNWFLSMFLLCAIGLYGLFQTGKHLDTRRWVAVSILVTFMQVASILAELRVGWSPLITMVFNLLSVVMMNLEVTAPECTIQQFGYYERWAASALTIVFFPLIMVSAYQLHAHLSKRMHRSEWYNVPFVRAICLSRRDVKAVVSVSWNAMIAYWVTSYTGGTWAAIGHLLCVKQADGSILLARNPSLVCYDDEWYRWLPVSLVTMLMHTLLIPCFLYFIIQHRIKGNVKDYQVKRRYFSLYKRYEYQHCDWEMVVMARKAGVLAIVPIAYVNTTLALTLIAIILSANMFAQHKQQPYYMFWHNIMETTQLLSLQALLYIGVLSWGNLLDTEPDRSISDTVAMLLLVTNVIMAVLGVALPRFSDTEYERRRKMAKLVREKDRVATLVRMNSAPRGGIVTSEKTEPSIRAAAQRAKSMFRSSAVKVGPSPSIKHTSSSSQRGEKQSTPGIDSEPASPRAGASLPFPFAATDPAVPAVLPPGEVSD